ncbi:MAG: glycerophosphodiester phosphodiesterase [Acidimicrobiales bacterium]
MGEMKMQAQGPLRLTGTPPLVLAHRGLVGPAPENSLDAFAAALAAGADGVELDVRLSADGVLVVHHDAEIAGHGAIAELPATALPARVPTLADALAACAGAVVDVEVKASPLEPGAARSAELAAAVARGVRHALAGPQAPAQVLVSSFWPAALEAVSGTAPELDTGLLVHPAFDAAEALLQAASLGCRVVLPFRDQVTTALVGAAREQSLGVYVWTVNSEEDLLAAVRSGADAVVTDDVAGARRVLGQR